MIKKPNFSTSFSTKTKISEIFSDAVWFKIKVGH